MRLFFARWGLFLVKQFVALVMLIATTAGASAADWTETSLPDYTDPASFVAIGGDGALYTVSSNPNGYVFTSILDKFRFEPTSGDGFSGRILGGKETVYLGSGCDASAMGENGAWSNDSTGLNFRLDTAGGRVRTFRVLDTGLQPHHSC